MSNLINKVTVYSTAGANAAVYDVPVTMTTFGELKTLIGNVYPFETSNCFDDNERIFSSDDSTLPTGDFALFVYPRQTKSGAMLPYTGAKRKIQELRDESSEARSFFGNYTTKSATDMNKLLDAWESKLKEEEVIQEVIDHSLSFDDILDFLRSKSAYYLGNNSNSQIQEDMKKHFLVEDEAQSKYETFGKKLGLI